MSEVVTGNHKIVRLRALDQVVKEGLSFEEEAARSHGEKARASC